jgi:hypothetical protein
VDIQIERAADTLNQGDRTSLDRLTGKVRLLDQMPGHATVEDAWPMMARRATPLTKKGASYRTCQHLLDRSPVQRNGNALIQNVFENCRRCELLAFSQTA